MGYTLTKTEPTQELVMTQTAFGMLLTVTSDDGVVYPPKVFVMQIPIVDGDEPWFNCVASPVQLIDYPVDAPDPPIDGVQQPYYRVATLKIVSRSPSGLLAFVTRVEEELAILEENLDALQTLENV